MMRHPRHLPALTLVAVLLLSSTTVAAAPQGDDEPAPDATVAELMDRTMRLISQRRDLARRLDAGEPGRALALFESLPAGQRQRLLAEPWGGRSSWPENRRLDLVAAALLVGRGDTAREWLTAVAAGAPAPWDPSEHEALRALLAHAAALATGEAAKADPFDLFSALLVDGDPADGPWTHDRHLAGRDTLLRLLVRVAAQERLDNTAAYLETLRTARPTVQRVAPPELYSDAELFQVDAAGERAFWIDNETSGTLTRSPDGEWHHQLLAIDCSRLYFPPVEEEAARPTDNRGPNERR